jgi:type VI secretion system secreted protein VgrG
VDTVVRGKRRERDEWDLHRRALQDRKERVGKDHSLLVYQDRQEKVGQSFARETGQELHVVAGHDAVGEAPDVTIKGPGGFIRIDALGVTISGTIVDINVSGSPGHGHGAHPKEVEKAIEAVTKTGAMLDAPDLAGMAVVDALKEALLDKASLNPFQSLQALELVRFAETADVSTPPGGLVLWSGGDVAIAAADELAAQQTAAGTPSMRLEKTPGGAALLDLTKGVDQTVQSPAWTTVSKRLAAQASGEVNVVVSYSPLREGAVFRDEAKMLAANPKVTSIKVWAVKTDANGPVKDANGKHVLEPIALKDVLAKPPPAPKRKKS